MNLFRFSLLSILLFIAVGARSQPSQLVYLKTFPSPVYPNSTFMSVPGGDAFVANFSASETFDASIWPDSDPYFIEPQFGRIIVIYDSDLNPIGHYQVQGVTFHYPMLRGGNTFVFRVKNLNEQTILFDSSPELTGDYPPFIYGENYIVTYNPESQELKMPFSCQCPGTLNTEHSYPVNHYMNAAGGILNGGFGSLGIATSDGRIITTIGQFDDVLINWEDEFPIGQNYWNTLWLKIDPISGEYIPTPLLSDQGTALTNSLFASETDNGIFRSGVVRGYGVPMSPDGTEWFTNQSDSMYYAFFLKENENGEQDWMKPLYAYNNTASDREPTGAQIVLRHFVTSKVELSANIFLSESYRFNVPLDDTLIFRDFFGNEAEYSIPAGYNPVTSGYNAKGAHTIYKFSSDGVPTGSLSLPLRNPNISTYENTLYQKPLLIKSGNKMGWLNQYKASQDTTIYFLRNSLNINIDSIGVNLPAGGGVFITWMDSYFNIITTTHIPFTFGSAPNHSGVVINSASLYHGDTLLLTGRIDHGTTTSLDPAGIAENIIYENSTPFLAFYTLPDIINSTPEIDTIEGAQVFTVFPNPGKSTFTIRGNQDEVLQSWTIFDLSGRLVAQGKDGQYGSENRIRLSLAPGVYLLSLKTKTGRTENHRIVVGD